MCSPGQGWQSAPRMRSHGSSEYSKPSTCVQVYGTGSKPSAAVCTRRAGGATVQCRALGFESPAASAHIELDQRHDAARACGGGVGAEDELRRVDHRHLHHRLARRRGSRRGQQRRALAAAPRLPPRRACVLIDSELALGPGLRQGGGSGLCAGLWHPKGLRAMARPRAFNLAGSTVGLAHRGRHEGGS